VFAFIVRRFWVIASCPGVLIRGKGQKIFPSVKLRATDGGRIVIAANCGLSRGLEIMTRGMVEIGERTFIGSWSTIAAASSITIGRDCLIAERVTIRDQNHAIRGDLDIPIAQASFEIAPIIIDDGVWIAAGAVVLKGVHIGRGAVIAANAVVVRDVADFEVVGGVPATRISMRNARK
jgi:acetyltransferase-like isoleucine patch superfamily enzyme